MNTVVVTATDSEKGQLELVSCQLYQETTNLKKFLYKTLGQRYQAYSM